MVGASIPRTRRPVTTRSNTSPFSIATQYETPSSPVMSAIWQMARNGVWRVREVEPGKAAERPDAVHPLERDDDNGHREEEGQARSAIEW